MESLSCCKLIILQDYISSVLPLVQDPSTGVLTMAPLLCTHYLWYYIATPPITPDYYGDYERTDFMRKTPQLSGGDSAAAPARYLN